MNEKQKIENRIEESLGVSTFGEEINQKIGTLPYDLVERAKEVYPLYNHDKMWKHILALQEKNSKELKKEVAVWSLASFMFMFKRNRLKEIFKTCSFCFLTKVDCTKCVLSCTSNKMFCFMMENKDMLTRRNIMTWLDTMNYWRILEETYNETQEK